jgi:hypothetical protein
VTGHPGFFGSILGSEAPERDADAGLATETLIEPPSLFSQGAPNAERSEAGSSITPVFDPVWGTLGAPTSQGGDDWLARGGQEGESLAVEVEIFGDGFHVSGQIRTGAFDRLSDWINMQSGFITVRDAWHVHPRETDAPDSDPAKATLWVRLDQIVMVAQRSPVVLNRPGAPAVQKQRCKVRIVTADYNVRGNVHVHTDGSMSHFLDMADPRFLPITDLTVQWGPDAALVTRFPFAVINRTQMLTVLDESLDPVGEVDEPEARDRDAACR